MIIYIHIPFCEKKCFYCAFNSYENKTHLAQKYFNALYKQIKNDLDFYNIQEKSLSSIYFGGGTPSAVNAKYYEKIFTFLQKYMQENCEISTEANPNSASISWLKQMKDYGVNRLSFGVQSFDDKKLKMLGRIHDKNTAINAINSAYKLNFENISLDLIYSTKFDDKNFINKELDNLSLLPINHISAYSLSLEENTPFHGKYHLQKDQPEVASYLFKKLNDLNFTQYEISNFGKICRHNLSYWKHEEYLGFGAGAVGFINNVRYTNHENIDFFIDNPCYKNKEFLSPENINFEKIFLGLRSCLGVKNTILSQKQRQKALTLYNEKLLSIKNDTFYANDFLLADELALFLVQD